MDTPVAEQHLTELAAELDQETFRTQMIEVASGRLELIITNRTAARLSERVKVVADDFVWSWGQVIAPITEHALAARRVSMVLAVVES
ncbi:hypothetical protein [Actinomadura opuntiae]|uniref:hypothetical protein n=1 Tax=Actinomadura sp. OS1-43 TaxID=604315 RepID=UPI00255A9915|nr:hypothetical protein [Actinomadura sp. OS1-43]MDL4815976.1 hypothetical protein [Actinomadura sp. OS1-43]